VLSVEPPNQASAIHQCLCFLVAVLHTVVHVSAVVVDTRLKEMVRRPAVLC